MSHEIKIYDLNSQRNKNFLDNVIFPIQTHSNNIIKIISKKENLKNCDGIFTSNNNDFSLGVKTADCAAISFYDNENFGVIHAGWRGLIKGIIEKMLCNFIDPNIFISPLLNEFEIKKDSCYEEINKRFGEKYFLTKKNNNNETIIFQFQKAIKDILPKNVIFDSRNTFDNKNLASWRRDKNQERNYTIILNKR